jgi:rod shape-determining protein MreD
MVFQPQSRRILKPVKPMFVVLSLAVAFVFNLLPWRDLRGVPDLVALVLCFWCIHQPRLMGIGIPFLCGLVMDAANGALLGQHALAYSFLAFAAQALSRRIQWFPALPQAIHVLVLLLMVQAIMLGVRMMAGGTFPGWAYFSGSVISALLWPLAAFVLLAPQRATQTDETATL